MPNAEIGSAKTYAFVDARSVPVEKEQRKGQKNHKAVFKKTSFGMRKL